MSTTVQGSDSPLASIARMSIALIGPNDSSRTIMAKALHASQDRVVREFADYPAKLSDVSRMMSQNFDVVMIDLDSDESYALLIVEKIAALGNTTVMVYSVRNDPSLVMSAMRAGARDFLPVPVEAAVPEVTLAPAPVAPPPAIPSAPPAVVPIQTRPAVTREVPPARPAVPQRVRVESQEPDEKRIYNNSAYVRDRATPAPAAVDVRKSDNFAGRTNQPEPTKAPAPRPAIAGKVVEPSPRPSFKPDLTTKTSPESVVASAVPVKAPVATGGIETDAELLALFRNIKVVDDRDVPPSNRKNLILIGAGAVAVVLVLVLIFVNPFKQRAASPTATPAQTAAPQIVSASNDVKTGKPAQPAAKPSPDTPVIKADAAHAATPEVKSAVLDPQFMAPGRISRDVKKGGSSEAAPAAFTAGAMDSGGGLPSNFIGNGNSRPKVVGTVARISAGVAEGMLLHRSPTNYPAIAKDTRVSGTVVLKASISKTGSIEGVRVVSGPKLLTGAAMDSVKTWRYRPYMLDGQPIEVETTISVIFSLGR